MRRIVCLLIVTFALGLVALAPVARADTPLRALRTGDENKGWEGVGRLNLGTRGFCTAALIAPDLILTAAHCLFDKSTGLRFPIAKMQFLADWRVGRAAAYRGITKAVIPPDYVYSTEDKLARVGHDLALLRLDQPIRLPSIQPFETETNVAVGESVGVVSYAKDRSETPSLQQICHVLGKQPGVLVLNCDVDFGSSGAPIFSIANGVARIVSVVSAKAEVEGKRVALGIDLTGLLDGLKAEMAKAENSHFQQVLSSNDGTLPQPGLQMGGAKFVKP